MSTGTPGPSKWVLMLCGLFAAVTALGLAGVLWGRGPWLLYVKTASTGFVCIALMGGGLYSGYGRLITLGLVCCWFGDVVGPGNFWASVGVFFLGHVMYIAAFATRKPAPRRCLYALAVLAPVVAVVLVWLLPHVPRAQCAPVLAYIAIITVMVTMAMGASRGAGGRLIALGAAVFFVSDIFVARWKFVVQDPVNAFFCYPLYYTACVLVAFSVPFARLGNEPRTAGPK